MPWKKNDLTTIKFAHIGAKRQLELHPNIYSEMGKKSRKYENDATRKLKKNFDYLFLPNEICDRVGIINNKIIFIEIKRNERHGKHLTKKQLLFRNLVKKSQNIGYLVKFG